MAIDQDRWKARKPEVQHSIALFEYEHLDPQLQAVSKVLCDAAETALEMVPDNPQTEFALLLLLAAKDAFVRSAVGGVVPPGVAPGSLP